jgi:4-hydroxy-3-methylbut-2-en-1-yl diphosphate reductase
MKIFLANPRGFCAGVDRAIKTVEHAVKLRPPVYVYHLIVHNHSVVANLKAQGVIFVEDINQVPEGATFVVNAHGVPPSLVAQAQQRNLYIIDATCPLVIRVHHEVMHLSKLGHECILIGHAAHPEVVGILGCYDNLGGGIYLLENMEQVDRLTIKNPKQLHYVTQTTFLADEAEQIIGALRQRFPELKGPKPNSLGLPLDNNSVVQPSDICYATKNRQEAVKYLAQQVDVVFVIGSSNSSNSRRLQELARLQNKPAYLIDGAQDIQPDWLIDKQSIGITAGASAPEQLVQSLIDYFQDRFTPCIVSELAGWQEEVTFPIAKILRDQISSA